MLSPSQLSQEGHVEFLFLPAAGIANYGDENRDKIGTCKDINIMGIAPGTCRGELSLLGD